VLHVTSSDGTGDFDSVGFTSSAGAAANAPATVVTDTVHNFKRGQFVSFHDVNATWNAITAAAPIQIISTPTTTSFTVEHFVILPAISSNSAGTIRAYKRLSVRAAGGMYVYRDGTNAGDIAAGSLVLGNNLANYGKDSLATVADGELAFIKSATPRYGSGANLYSKNGTTNVSTSGSFDVGGQLNVNGDLDIGVSDTSTAGAIVFKGGAGGSIRAFSATAGNDSLGIYNTAGTAGGFLVAENFYPGSQGSAFMGHDGNFTFNDSVDVTGNVTATGTFTATANVSINGAGLFHDTPTGVTLASGSTVGRTALWTVNTGTQYMLQRWTSTSTAALKKNISATSLAPEQVYNLSLVDFEYDREKFTELYPHINVEATGTQRGVIWEQVADVLPEAAVQGYGPGDPPTIDWEALYFGALVAIQDLNERVKALENPS
jgi:hypothetical protein